MPTHGTENSAAISAARCSTNSGLARPLITTVAPWRASTRATAQPMPRVDPVMSATLPLRLKMDSILPKNGLGLGETTEIDHVVGGQHDVESVLDFGDQTHVSD